MGKQIILKGADFSANALVLNIADVVSDDFFQKYALGTAWGTKQASNTRCCVLLADLSQYVGAFHKIKVTLNNGFDYVAAMGSQNSGVFFKGNEQVVTFAWVTDYEYVIMPLSEKMPYLSLNLRYEDNTTEFTDETKLTDIVKEIILY